MSAGRRAGQKHKARVPKQRSMRSGRRGCYASYDPLLRGEIALYALENGNSAAREHFRKTHGIDLPESTIRGLRDKIAAKMGRNTANKEKE